MSWDVGRDFRVRLAALSALALLLYPTPVLAQPPDRDSARVYHVAIQQTGAWEFFPPNTEAAPHRIRRDQIGPIELYWGAPPSGGAWSEVAFVRTAYRSDQTVSLHRNGVLSLVTDLWGAFHEVLPANGRALYVEFHRARPANPRAEQWLPFVRWPQTALWFPNVATDDFMRAVTTQGTSQQPAAERLIRLRSGRPLMSWVRVETRSPRVGGTLRLAASFSGEGAVSGEVVYEYWFQVRGP